MVLCDLYGRSPFRRSWLSLFVCVAFCWLSSALAQDHVLHEFEKLHLDEVFYSEGATVGDVVVSDRVEDRSAKAPGERAKVLDGARLRPPHPGLCLP